MCFPVDPKQPVLARKSCSRQRENGPHVAGPPTGDTDHDFPASETDKAANFAVFSLFSLSIGPVDAHKTGLEPIFSTPRSRSYREIVAGACRKRTHHTGLGPLSLGIEHPRFPRFNKHSSQGCFLPGPRLSGVKIDVIIIYGGLGINSIILH